MPVIPTDYIGSDSGRIAIKFFNGSEVVTGYIVQQTGSRRYVVSDGMKNYTVSLVRTIEDTQNLKEGMATIEIFPFVDGKVSSVPEHIQRIEQFTCYTVEGHRYDWRFAVTFMIGTAPGASKNGEANIAQIQ